MTDTMEDEPMTDTDSETRNCENRRSDSDPWYEPADPSGVVVLAFFALGAAAALKFGCSVRGLIRR